MGFGNPIIGGAASLIRAAIRSPNYVAGSTGWSINKDGTFDLVGGTFRGTITLTLANGTILVISNNYIQFFKPDGVTAVGLIQPMDPVNGGLAVFGQDGPASSALYLTADAAGSVVVPGVLAANEPGAVAATVEPWHPMTLKNSWAAAAGTVTNKYRLVPSPAKCVEIIGSLSGAAATATTFATLPAGYIPASAQRFAAEGASASGGPGIACDTSGNLSVGGAPALPAADNWWYHGLISLDA